MKRTLLFVALVAAAALSAQSGSAASFSYHGVLQDSGKPAQGKYDIELTLYSGPAGGNIVGGPLQMLNVDVKDGAFVADADFGPLAKSFKQAYVGVKVRQAGTGDFTPLGSLEAVVDTNTSCPGSWSLDGNAGNPAGSYLGTADNVPLTFRVAGKIAGVITPAQGVAFGQGTSLAGASATGRDSFATGEGVVASGVDSFAAGTGVLATQDGSYIWGDSEGGITQPTGTDQYIVRAAGGVAINGAPKNNATELSIYSADYPNIFLGTEGKNGGILLSANPASTATANNAAFAIDLYDGTNQARKFYVDNGGVVVNDPANIPAGVSSGNIALSVVHSASVTSSLIDMFGQTSDSSYYELTSSDKFILAQYIPGSAYNQRLIIAANGDLTVSGNAFKPGGGTWSATSDRRVKQDIAPIGDALETVMRLKPVTFHYTPEYRALEGGLADKSYAGFIAQEYAEVFPESVSVTDKAVPGAARGDQNILALDPNPALITTVAAVQELATENAQLHRQLDELAARLSKLESHGRN